MIAVGPPQLALALGDHLVLTGLASMSLQDRAVEMSDYLFKDFLKPVVTSREVGL